MLKRLKKSLLMALAMTAVMPAAAQDLIANQAPIDRKLRAVDSIQLNQLLESEVTATSPVAQLYDDWNNQYVGRQTTLPDSFLIDLRDFAMPSPSRLITSNFGPRWGRQHKGLDIKLNTGDTIVAAFPGKVRIVRYEAKGYGNYVVIRHPNGLETIYGHMSKQLVTENQEVRAGQPIGLGGSTGRSTGSHLHFETRLCGVALNPALFFDFKAQDVTGDFYTFRKSTIDRESAQATRLRGKNDGGGYRQEDVTGRASNNNATAQSQQRSSGAAKFHKVQAGETAYSIARKYNITVEKLAEMNHLGKDLRIRPGQLLKYS